MRLHDYTPPVRFDGLLNEFMEALTEGIDQPGEPSATEAYTVRAAAMYTVPTPEELTDATARVIERLQADKHVDPLAAAYQAVLEAAGRRMAKAFRSQAVALTADSRFVPPDEDEVVNGDRLAGEIGELAGEAQREAGRVVVAELDDEGISYDVDTVFTEELLERVASHAAFNLEGQLRDTYRNTLEVAAQYGWSVADTAEALQVKVADLAPHTARAIARTELNGLANGGSVHVAANTVGKDQTLYKNWLATDDERTRESHVEADGQSVLVNEHFTVGFASLSYPGDPFGPPEEVINCRCTVTYSSQPAGTVVEDPEGRPRDPLALVTPSDDVIEAISHDWERSGFEREHAQGLSGIYHDLEAKLARELAADRVTLRIRTPEDVAVQVADDGRFKSQFESARSGGMYAPAARARAEGNLFSYPEDMPVEQRPIYGYVGGVTRETGSVQQYGDVMWVLKNSVRERTTWTADDSLGMAFAPSPIDRPSAWSINPFHVTDPIDRPLEGNFYVEAQVHGGVTLDDVERVEVFYWPGEVVDEAGVPREIGREYADAIADELRGRLSGRGITVEVKSNGGSLGGSGEQTLNGAEDRLAVNVVGDVAPVASGDDAERRHLRPEERGALVEDPHLGRPEAVAATPHEDHVVVGTTLGDHLHTTDDSRSSGGSQPSGPLPSHDANEEAPMSTTIQPTTEQFANADGEVEMVTPVAWDAVLCAEGETTEDGRLLERGSISWRDLPLTLMGMLKTGGWGHEGAEVAGRIDSISRVADELPASGELTSTFGVNQLAPLIADRTVRGVSIDLAVLDWEYRDRDTGQKLSEDDLFIYWLEGREQDIVFTVLEGTIVGATVCPMPAIANAEITLAASAGLSTHARQLVAAAIDGRNIGPDDVRIISVFTPFDRVRGQGLFAAAAVELAAPPRSHFEVSEFPGKTPLTVTDADEHGYRRVFGHIATWDTCHVGLPGVCTTAPRSGTDPAYALFHQGQYETDEGMVDVGKLMLGTGHADLGASRMEATRHYDKPSMVGAYVRAVDGEHGIWVSGIARPELTAAGLRELRANPPSGDWRSYNGRLELIAVCAVAVPGFPVVADAKANITAAGGQASISALIASSGLIVPTSAVKEALVAAGCGCEDLATDDEYVDDLADLGG